jgi:dienelactone hydrolase
VSHRNVETLIGRLATDPTLRRRFAESPAVVLREFRDQGYELTGVELEALRLTSPEAIRSFADTLDRRLRRAEVAPVREKEQMTMSYNPFERGPSPVGVRTLELRHSALADHPVPLELWYPATETHRGQDLDAATWDQYTHPTGLPAFNQQAVRDAAAVPDNHPLVLYCHGAYGQRRESSRICTHLASHGYVVASADFPGDNIADLIPRDGTAVVSKTPVDESARKRPSQASLFVDLLLAMTLPSGLRVDPRRIGTAGISMGGFTSLALNSIDTRIGATFPMCPMFGERSMLPQCRRLQNLLRVDSWLRPVPTLLLTGDLDPLVNVQDIRLLYSLITAPKRLVVVRRAGHMHWADNAEQGHEWFRKGYLSGEFPDPEVDGIALGTAMRPFAELCTEEQANATARGLCLAHMDAHLNDDRRAQAFLDSDLPGVFAARGVDIEVTASLALTR